MGKRPFGGNYKTYDPETEGFGSPNQWRNAFHKRMSREEAQEILHGQRRTAHEILGVGIKATKREILSAYRRLALLCHPDRILVNSMTVEDATEKFKVLTAAYTELA